MEANIIHLHLFIQENNQKIIVEVSREITKSETKKEIATANTILDFISKPKDFIQFSSQEEQQKDPSDWWKDDDDGDNPKFKRN